MASGKHVLSYRRDAKRNRGKRVSFGSVLCAVVLPIIYLLFPDSFSSTTPLSRSALAILGLSMTSGGAAVVLGMWALVQWSRLELRGRIAATIGLVMGLTNCAAIPFLRSYQTARLRHVVAVEHTIMTCSNHVRDIGTVIAAYCDDNGGTFPTQLSDLLQPGYLISSHTLTCPFTRQSQVSNGASGPISYIYLGQRMTSASDPKCVVLYEPLTNHPLEVDGVSFLFADGHSQLLSPRRAEALIGQLESGINPPRWRN